MNILIVVPRYISSVGRYYEFPLGLAYISSALKHHGFRVFCLNLNHSCEAVESVIGAAIERYNIDVLCTGGLSPHYAKIKLIIEAARLSKKEIRVILGGGIISSDPELIMKLLRPDFGVIGEGELTIVELASGLLEGRDCSSINGIAFLSGKGEPVVTNPRKVIADIDTIEHPDYDGFELEKYLSMQMPADEYHLYPYDEPRVVPMIASRSCPYNCTFCFHPLGSQYRQRSLDSFFAELDHLVTRYSINIVSVSDELFSLKAERTREFCSRIRKYDLKYLVQMRVDGVDAEVLSLLRGSGCMAISYGLESASDAVLKSMRKHSTIARIEKALEMTYQAGMGIQGNFIFGDKAETKETADATINWWAGHRKYQINLTPLFIYPGTGVYRHAIENGIIKDRTAFLEKGCPPLNITTMSDDEYAGVISAIYKMSTQNPFPARVVSCKKTGKHPLKGDLYHIDVICPHCGVAVSYNNMHQGGNMMFALGSRICCRNCNQRFDILPYRFYEYLNSGAVKKEGDILSGVNAIAIYGAGISGSTVYDFCVNSGKKVLYFIDDFKEGSCNGIEVIKPEAVGRYPCPDLTIFAVGSSLNLPLIKEKMASWRFSKACLFTQSEFPDVPDVDGDIVFSYYRQYYFERWLPLLEKGVSRNV